MKSSVAAGAGHNTFLTIENTDLSNLMNGVMVRLTKGTRVEMSDGWGGTVDHVSITQMGAVASAYRDGTKSGAGHGCRSFFSKHAVVAPDGRVLVAWQAATKTHEGTAIDISRVIPNREQERVEESLRERRTKFDGRRDRPTAA